MAYRLAPLKLQQHVQRRFERSDLGRAAALARRGQARPGDAAQVRRVLENDSRMRPVQAINRMMGADFSTMVQTMEQYRRRGAAEWRVVKRFLASLGPAGALIRSMVEPNQPAPKIQRHLRQAAALIKAWGGNVIPGGWGSVAEITGGIESSITNLQHRGYQVARPGQRVHPRMHPAAAEAQPEERTVRINGVEYPKNHPVVTGKFVRAPSSTNVYEFGYDVDNHFLYVRYQESHERGTRGGPGPLYRYTAVLPYQFITLYNAGSKGRWVWDNLRIRGTISGHQHGWELVGVMEGQMVPRRATVKPVMGTTRGGRPKKLGSQEWFVLRQVQTPDGRLLRSRPEAPAGPVAYSVARTRGATPPRGPRRG
jgi:hypothetical protein